jgi:hypothetical protein
LPRKGHLEAVCHLYAYLKKMPNGTIVLDPTYPDIDLTQFNGGADWSKVYVIEMKDSLYVSLPWQPET